nr:hypothetical protein [Oceanococcus sp. HetDA_MAG_MS8]
MKIAPLAAIALLCPLTALAATPSSGTLTIYETELSFGEGPVVGVNPTPAIAAETGTGINCEPGITCDRFDLTIDVPDNLTEVYPTAILRLQMSWTNPTGLEVEDYDFYAYDADGNEIGSSAELNANNPNEAITLAVTGGVSEIRLDMVYFAVAGSTYEVVATLDLGQPSPDADLEAFFADNPPDDGAMGFFIAADEDQRTAQARSAQSSGGGGLGGLLLVLATLGLRRRG